MSMRFTVGGKVCDADGVRAGAQQAKSPVKREADKYHRGWLVCGYPPGFVDQAYEAHASRVAKWSAMDPAQQAEKIKLGQRAPDAWSEAAFVAKTKRHKVRPRPFESQSAVEDARQLAERLGWSHIEVIELSKGEPPQEGMF